MRSGKCLAKCLVSACLALLSTRIFLWASWAGWGYSWLSISSSQLTLPWSQTLCRTQQAAIIFGGNVKWNSLFFCRTRNRDLTSTITRTKLSYMLKDSCSGVRLGYSRWRSSSGRMWKSRLEKTKGLFNHNANRAQVHVEGLLFRSQVRGCLVAFDEPNEEWVGRITNYLEPDIFPLDVSDTHTRDNCLVWSFRGKMWMNMWYKYACSLLFLVSECLPVAADGLFERGQSSAKPLNHGRIRASCSWCSWTFRQIIL